MIQAQGAFPETVLLQNVQYWEVANLDVSNKPTGSSPTRGHFRGIYVNNQTLAVANHFYLHDNVVHDIYACVDLATCKTQGGIFVASTQGKLVNDLRIENNSLYNLELTGISTNLNSASETDTSSYFTNVIVRGNTLAYMGGDGIIVRYAMSPLIEKNIVHDGGLTATGAASVAIWVRSTRNALVQSNEVYRQSGSPGDGEGLDADLNSEDSIFQYNYSHDNTGGFVLIMQTALRTIMRYNISLNDGTSRLGMFTLHNQLLAYNNTFVITSGTYEWIGTIDDDTSVFTNNIFYRPTSGGNWYASGATHHATFANNVFYGYHPTDEPADANKLTSDPHFLHVASAGAVGIDTNDGYRLVSGSPAIGTGASIANNGGKDYFGNTLGTGAPNRGAFGAAGISALTPFKVYAEADSYVQDGSLVSDNYGISTAIGIKGGTAVGYRRYGFVRFDLANISSISDAQLGLYGSNIQDASAVPLSVYQNLASWDELTLTWSNMPSHASVASAVTNISNTAQYYTWDITTLAQSVLSSGKIDIALLDASSADRSLQFNSKESAKNISYVLITP